MVLCLGLPLALGTVNSAQSSPTSLGLLAQASRWVEVGLFSGRVTYRGREQRAARSGDRLLTGQGLATARRATAVLEIDDNIGVVRVAEQTDLAVTQLGVLPDGARVTRFTVNRGQARVQARPFTNPNSLLEVTTPSGVVSVRGTEYGLSVAADGKTAVATLEGVVAATAAGQSVNVEAGFATVIRPGEPPLAPFALDRELDLRLSHQRRGSRQLNLEGYVNPANSVLINGQEIPVNRRGFFSTHLTVPANQAFLTVIVRNPLGEERRHRLSIREVDDN
ncbi:MAG: FecR domain-containing protein [Nodosilinea sp.]